LFSTQSAKHAAKVRKSAGRYAPPVTRRRNKRKEEKEVFPIGNFESLSESLDNFYLEKEAEQRFQVRAKAAAAKLKQEIGKREKLVKKLKQDLANHGDAEKWKRSGDLILANLADAVRMDGKILVVDYFDENIPTVEIEADENDSLTTGGGKVFRRYTKARNAKEEISKRLEILKNELEELNAKKSRLDEAIAEKDESIIDEFSAEKIENYRSNKEKNTPTVLRARADSHRAKVTKFWSEKRRRIMIT
jgi:predicted ribosome quality control (RQC) complex YloA/Tae2 family protein